MENIHHSLPKRSNGGYASSHKSGVYDGVFAAAPAKFGLTALAPRHEDYVEIFGGFHAARSSSIPVLDVPAIDGDELELDFDVKSSGFDYKEVFGECRGLDWTASFEDVVAQSSGGYDSSDEAWSPSQSGSLSDELDPLAGSDKSSRLSNGDAQQSLESNMQFNVCYNKSSQRVTETVLAGTTHVTKFGPVPVHTSSQYETSVPSNEHCPLHVTEDINPDKKFDGRDPVEEYSKCSSNPLYSGFSKSGNDSNTSETHVGTSSSLDRPFMTISDISLRTKPSRLPPPSRAPPALAAKRAECDGSISKHKPLKSYSLDGVAEGSSPPFFDVEEDADLSADSSTHGNKNMHAKHICSDESIDRKEVRSHAKGHLGDFKKVEDRRNKIVGACSSFQASDGLQLHGEETLESVPSFEDRIASRKSADKFSDSQGGQYCDHISEKTAGDVFGRVETEYFEVVGKDIYIEPFQTMENYNSLMQHMNPEANRHLRATDFQVSNQNESVKKFKVTKEVPRWDEKRLDIKRDGDDCDGANQQQMRKLNTRLGDETVKVNLNKLTCVHDLDRMMPSGAQQPVESGIQQIDQRGSVKGQVETKNVNGVETKAKPHASSKTVEIEKKFVHAQKMEENRGKHEENIVREEGQRILEDAEQAESIEKIHGKIEHEGIMKRENRACGKENENEIMKSRVLKENEMIPEETNIHESVKKSCISDGHGRKGGEQNPLEVDKDKELLMEAGKPKVNEVAFTRAFQHSENYTEQELAPEKKLTKERKEDAFTKEDNDLRFEKAEAKLGNKGGYFEIEANEHLSRYTVQELGGQAEDGEPVESNRPGDEVNWDLESDVIVEGDLLKVLDGACELDKGTATRVDKKHANLHKLETAEEAFSCKENMELKTRPNISDNESGAGTDDPVIKVKFSKFSKNNDEFQVGNSGSMKDAVESTSLPKQMRNPNVGGTGAGSTRVVTDKAAPAMVRNHKTQKIISNEDDRELKMKGTQVVIEKVDIRDSLPTCPAIREPVVNGRKVEDASLVFEHNQDLMYSTRNATKQSNGRNDKNTKYNLAAKDPKVGERIRRETDLENERIRKLEEEREREREREKDRMAVDKAALEARERSYAEARERAAVERATAEVRQRAMAEARERLEKTSMEARSRAERASVERATAEAWQRAVEKSMAEKAAFDARDRVEKSVSDRFSVFHRSVDTRQSSLSSDLHFQSTGMSNGLRHSYFSANAGAEGESPQRSKARLERYRRTAERAANALAEKNMRDLLAQKEREERNRVAEVLDAEVKRWSSGKEGNLRALLSTLQYILGPDSGWHPVPLTDVITSAAVKKAYRKATLCVHPDKLQQRGATIQQKYICEKVFDLLKEAWNKFNSEER